MTQLALLANIQPRVKSILGATPGAWSTTVTAGIGAWPSDTEIDNAIIEADGLLITRAYFNSANNTLAQGFMIPSSPLPGGVAAGVDVPTHYGNVGRVEIATLVTQITSVNTSSGILGVATGGVANLSLAQPVSLLAASGAAIPSGLAADTTTYYAIPVDGSSFKVANTVKDAFAGNAVIPSTTGSGNFSIIAWEPGQEAERASDIIGAVAGLESYVGSGSLSFLWKIDHGNFYTSAKYGRVETPQYTRQATLQANRSDETVVTAISIGILEKNASPAPFTSWGQKGENWIQQIIRDGAWTQEDENE